jgi:hypothetical protein
MNNKLENISDKHKIDLLSLNNFLLEKGDDLIDILLQVNGFKEKNLSNKRLLNYYISIIYSNEEDDIKRIPKELWNIYSFREKAVSKNGWILEFVSKHLRDYSICEKAVFTNGTALEFVPEELRDYSLCEKAISQDGTALQFVPDNIENYYSLCEKAVTSQYGCLPYVSKKIIDYSLCEKAVLSFSDSIFHVPKHLQDFHLWEIVVSNDKTLIYYIEDPLILKQIKEKFNLREYISREVKKLLKELLFKRKVNGST